MGVWGVERRTWGWVRLRLRPLRLLLEGRCAIPWLGMPLLDGRARRDGGVGVGEWWAVVCRVQVSPDGVKFGSGVEPQLTPQGSAQPHPKFNDLHDATTFGTDCDRLSLSGRMNSGP